MGGHSRHAKYAVACCFKRLRILEVLDLSVDVFVWAPSDAAASYLPVSRRTFVFFLTGFFMKLNGETLQLQFNLQLGPKDTAKVLRNKQMCSRGLPCPRTAFELF